MQIFHDQNLADYSTMHLGGPVAHVAEIHSRQEFEASITWAKNNNLPIIMIGGGSNIIWQDTGFSGLLLLNKIEKYDEFIEDETNYYLTIGAGENWDRVVERSVVSELTGIEALSLVPGTAGATPVQNVGAYGQELSQTLVSLEVFDATDGKFKTMAGFECGFNYRNSRFKTGPDRGRFFIMGLTLHLMKTNPLPPFYPSVQQYFENHNISQPTPSDLREAVIAIRKAKLPDPAIVNNCGSFFANPIVDSAILHQIESDYSPVPNWPVGEGKIKLSSAWLIEQAGFKNYHDEETGMATWPTQPLVLVNEKARSTANLLAFKQKIVEAVQQKFQITLLQEPELLP